MNWKITREWGAPSSGVPEIDEVVWQQIARDMERRIEREFISGMTSNTLAESLTPLDGEKLVEDLDRLIRNARRSQFVVIVDAALSWDAPLLLEQTPCDGQHIEMSHRQANELHQHWPLKLHKVLSAERAEFVPVSGIFPELVPRILPAPPYDFQIEQQD